MRAGLLRHEIELEREVETVADSGAVVKAWQHYADRRAELRQSTADEFLNGTVEGASQKAVFVIRWTEGVKVGDRLLHAGKAWQIVGLVEIGVQRGLELMVIGS
ncbi:MAG: head-tail adaptor protein [Rhodobacteraceae bacterium]|nr:head-tail adaptor protein [Paracoccaceae bacterium]MCF8512981.1 head-tail adaptor protein [Paracoccaceae bacterium]MCF8517226.1 head-tail adaptor protein [Paracoccaceae bacterium]